MADLSIIPILLKAYFLNELRGRKKFGRSGRLSIPITYLITLFLGFNFGVMAYSTAPRDGTAYAAGFLLLFFVFQLLITSMELKRLLFSPRDTLLLISYPIDRKTLFLSRILFIYLYSIMNGLLIWLGGAVIGVYFTGSWLMLTALLIPVLIAGFFAVFIAISSYLIIIVLMGHIRAGKFSMYLNIIFTALIYLVFILIRPRMGELLSSGFGHYISSFLAVPVVSMMIGEAAFDLILIALLILACILSVGLTYLIFSGIYRHHLALTFESGDSSQEVILPRKSGISGKDPIYMLLDIYLRRSRELKGRVLTFLLMLAVIIAVRELDPTQASSADGPLITYVAGVFIYFLFLIINSFSFSSHHESSDLLRYCPTARGEQLVRFHNWLTLRFILPLSFAAAAYLMVKSGILPGLGYGAYLFMMLSAGSSLFLVMRPLLPFSLPMTMRRTQSRLLLNIFIILPFVLLTYFVAKFLMAKLLYLLLTLIFWHIFYKINTLLLSRKRWRK
ncbi:hypothetical protein KAU32_04235 [bacterium]|nr:hypothetical protein [bacterium]